MRYRAPPRPERINFDEARVPPYSLPDPLRSEDGSPIVSSELWATHRREELLESFRREVYGRAPPHRGVEVREVIRDPLALGGLATRLELDVEIVLGPAGGVERRSHVGLLMWIPNRTARHPTFLGLNLAGNQTVHPDREIRLARGWSPLIPEAGLDEHVANESSRGMLSQSWPVEFIVARGYALATAYAGDLESDYPEGALASPLRAVTSAASSEVGGSICAWAFGLSRALDALETIDGIDARRVALIGHSRLGKAALWAAAQDQRFALIAANGSGRAGVGLLRRRFGETIRDLNQRFPHWFCENFRRYEGREAELTVDQHELIALVAPRPVCIGDGELDLWCDPRASLLASLAATPVYRLLGTEGIDISPDGVPLGRLLGDRIGYHRRPGNHGLQKSDWWQYLAFADRFLRA